MARVDRVSRGFLVLSEEDAQVLYWGRYYGRPLGSAKPRKGEKLSPLKLSRHEVIYLQNNSEVEVYDGRKRIRLTPPSGKAGQTYAVYADLRNSGFIVRSGLKFGATFACYVKGPGIDHAPFLVQVVSEDTKLSGLEVIRAGRLSHGIRKNFVFAAVDKTGKTTYLTLSWVKP